jgi:hypothetical protein
VSIPDIAATKADVTAALLEQPEPKARKRPAAAAA